MAVTNLGMGLSGFGIERPASQVVQSGDEYANAYNDWLRQAQRSISDASAGYGGYINQLNLQNTAQNAIGQQMAANGFSADQINGANPLQAMAQNGVGSGWNASTTAAINAALPGFTTQTSYLDQQAAQQAIADAQNRMAAGQQDWQTKHDQYVNNQAASQQAYYLSNGNGFAGGLLNSSYANPFGNTVTGSADPAASANAASGFNTGLMGQGGSAAAPSTGLAPTTPAYTNPWATPPAQTQQQGASGWGGPFSAKNPWSLS